MGAAFLLLEVQNISKASVVLGNAWWVNAVIISGILAMILLANLIEGMWPKRLPQNLVWSCLIGTCVALYFIDLSRFGFLPYGSKVLIVATLTTVPMLFSGIVFIRSFAAVERKDLALGREPNRFNCRRITPIHLVRRRHQGSAVSRSRLLRRGFVNAHQKDCAR